MVNNSKAICEITIDKEGLWHFRGEEMRRFDIVQYLYSYLKVDEQGRYLIEIDNDRCYVDVEDAPYVIKSIVIIYSGKDRQPVIELSISDGSNEILQSETRIWVGKENVLYCQVKNGRHHARFSRSAYYEICRHIEYDPETGNYSINLKNCSNHIFIYSLDQNGGSNVR